MELKNGYKRAYANDDDSQTNHCNEHDDDPKHHYQRQHQRQRARRGSG
jgi:hypothetical protein